MRLAHQSIARFVGQGGVQAVVLVRAMILARTLTKEEFGAFGQVLLVSSTVAPFLLFGLQTTLPVALARLRSDAADRLLIAVFSYLGFFGLCIATAVGLGSEAIASALGDGSLERPLLLGALLIVSQPFPNLIGLTLLVKRQPVLSSSLPAAGETFATITALSAFWVWNSVAALLAGLAVARLLAASLGIALVLRGSESVRHEVAGDNIDKGAFVRSTLTIGIASVVSAANGTIDRVLIALWYSSAAFAEYRAGAFEIPVFPLIVGAIFPVLAPSIGQLSARGRLTDALGLWIGGVRQTTIIVFPLAVFAVLYAEEVMVLVWSNAYAGSATVFAVYSLSLFARNANYGVFLAASGGQRFALYGSVTSLVINLGVGILLVGAMGGVGVALATVLARYSAACVSMIGVSQSANTGLAQVFPWVSVGKALLLSTCLVGSSRLVPVSGAPIGVLVSIGLVSVLVTILTLMRWGK